MSKRKTAKSMTEEGLHVVKNAGFVAEKRDKTVNKRAGLRDKKQTKEGVSKIYRRKPLALKHKRRIRKVALAFSSVLAVTAVGVVGIGFFKQADVAPLVDYGYSTVCYELPADGSSPASHTALEAVGYMNYRLKMQSSWYSEFHSKVHTIMEQEVTTYKQFYDGVLISSDITTSSLVNSAKQFCTTGDKVLWRNSAGGPETYNGMHTKWSESLAGNLSIEGSDGYKAKRGFPPSEFSVYVINEHTLLSEGTSEKVQDNGDGTYSVKLNLNAGYSEADNGESSAIYYYRQQMVVSGGLTALPEFRSINVTYTFDGDWQILKCEVVEDYTAYKGVPADCVAESVTEYSYEKEKAVNDYYKTFFEPLVNKDVAPEEEKLTAADCLSVAFGSVLTDGAVFKLQASAGELPLNGVVNVEMADGGLFALSLKLGDITAYVLDEKGEKVVYLALGGNKYKLNTAALGSEPVNTLAEGAEETAEPEKTEEKPLLDMDELLAQLGNEEAFSVSEDGKSAKLSPVLELFGLKIPLEFNFGINGKNITLDFVKTSLKLGETPLDAKLTFGSKSDAPAPLTDSAKAEFTDLLNDGIAVKAQIGIDKLKLDGTAFIGLNSGKLSEVRATLGGINVIYAENTLYLDLGATAKYKVALTAAEAKPMAENGEPDLQKLFQELLGGLTTDENGLTISTDVNLFETLLKIAVTVNINNGFGMNATVNALGKTVSVSAGFGDKKETPAPLTEDAKKEYTDILNDGITLRAELGIDNLKLNGTAFIGLNNGKLSEVRAKLGGLNIHFTDGILYIDGGTRIAVKLGNSTGATPAIQAEGEENSTVKIIKELMDALTFTEDGIVFNKTLNLFEQETQITLNIGLTKGISVGAEIGIFGKQITATAGFGDINDVPKPLKEVDKAEYIDLLQEFSLSGSLAFESGGTAIELAVDNLALSFENGVGFAMQAKLIADGVYHDIYARYADSSLTFAYGTAGFKIDTVKGLDTIGSAIVAAYNKVAEVVNEVTGTATLKEVEKLDDLLTMLKISGDSASGVNELLKLINIPLGEDGKPDITEIFKKLKLSQEDGNIKVVLGENIVVTLGIGDAINIGGSLGLELGGKSAVVKLKDVSLKAYSEPVCPVEKLLTEQDLADMIDYITATAGLIIEKEYSLDSQTTLYEGGAAALDVGVALDYIRGDGFPIEVTLPEKDENGNEISGLKVNFRDDMYFHLGVGLTRNKEAALNYTVDENGNKIYKDDLYLDIYILDANPAVADGKTTGLKSGAEACGDGLDVYLSLSKYSSANAELYSPLKVYAPVNEILTVLAAGVAVLDLQGIDISEESKELQSVISTVAKLLDDALVKAKLPYTHSQFESLGASLIPRILGTDLSTLIKTLLNTLTAKEAAQSEPAVPAEPAEPANPPAVSELACGNYIKSISLGTAENGDRAFSIVLNSASIYGDGFDDIVFEAYKNCSYGVTVADTDGTIVQGKTQSYLTGAKVNNIYFGGNKKLNFALAVNREVAKLADYGQYYDFSGIDTLLKAAVNSATHKTTDRDKEIAEELNRPLTDYTLNSYYLISGNVIASILGIDIDIDTTLSVKVDEKTNGVILNVHLEYAGKFAYVTPAINGNTVLDLTIKDGMIYMKRVQTTKVTFTNQNGGDKITPITIYRVMPLSSFASAENLMDNLGFILNFGDFINSQLKDAGSGSGSSFDSTGMDFGELIGTFLAYFSHSAKSDSASWELAISGEGLTKLIGMTMENLVVTFTADTKYDAGSNSRMYLLTGLSLKTNMVLVKNVVNLNVEGNLKYCNPQENMIKGYTDKSENVSVLWEQLFGCSSKTLATVANGLKEGKEYPPEVITANERWKKAVKSLNTGKNYIEVNSSSSTGVNLGEVAYYANGEKVGFAMILYGDTAGLLSVNPVALEWKDWQGYGKRIDYIGVTLNADGTLSVTDFANPNVSATYTPKKFNVTVTSNFAQEFTENIEYVYDTELNLIKYFDGRAVEVDGVYYTIVALEFNGKQYCGNIAEFNTLGDVTFTAVWDKVDTTREFEVVYIADGKEVETRKVLYGNEIDLSVVPEAPTGYYFDGWEFGGLKTVYSNREVTAIFKPLIYTVTLDLNGYDCAEAAAEAGFVNENGNLVIKYTYDTPALTLNGLGEIPGYEFLNYYYLDGEEKVAVSEIYNITSDTTIYPEFKDIRIHAALKSDIPFSYNGQNAVAVTDESGNVTDYELLVHIIREESTLAEAVGVDEGNGYNFLGWWYRSADSEETFVKLSDALTVARPGETISFEIRALWGKVSFTSHSGKRDGGFFSHPYKLNCSVKYEIVGESSLVEKVELANVTYIWYTHDSALSNVETTWDAGTTLTNYSNEFNSSKMMYDYDLTANLTLTLSDGSSGVISAKVSGGL